MTARKYVRVELQRLRELELLLADPAKFAQDHGFSGVDTSDTEQNCRAYSVGWAGSLVKAMLQDAGEPPSQGASADAWAAYKESKAP